MSWPSAPSIWAPTTGRDAPTPHATTQGTTTAGTRTVERLTFWREIHQGSRGIQSEVWLNAVNSRGCMMDTADASEYSASMFKAPIESPLFAAVIDARGVTAYVNPSWEGLEEKTAAATLSATSPSSASSTVFIAEAGTVIDRLVDTKQLSGTVAVPHLTAPLPGARRGVSRSGNTSANVAAMAPE